MDNLNKQNRLTCFLCRYEITKNNKSEKQIKFAGKFKPICKYCTKTKHKVLSNTYENVDIQCKMCNKPSKYKKTVSYVLYVTMLFMEIV